MKALDPGLVKTAFAERLDDEWGYNIVHAQDSAAFEMRLWKKPLDYNTFVYVGYVKYGATKDEIAAVVNRLIADALEKERAKGGDRHGQEEEKEGMLR